MMRIKVQSMQHPFRSHYEIEEAREQIRYTGIFSLNYSWNFGDQAFRTWRNGQFLEIYCDEKKVASCSNHFGLFGEWLTGSRPLKDVWLREWTVVDHRGQHLKIIEKRRSCGGWAEWKSVAGKQTMVFRRERFFWGGTAVIRSDWSESVGLLVGMIVPLCLSIN